MTRLLQAAHEVVRVAVSSRAGCMHELRAPVKNHQQFQTGQILACSHRRPHSIGVVAGFAPFNWIKLARIWPFAAPSVVRFS
jgi:hypothetical protein